MTKKTGIMVMRGLYERRVPVVPTAWDCEAIASNLHREWTQHGFHGIVRLLMLAGFCLALIATPASGQSRERYLVSEPWCSHCPAARSRFLASGGRPENILTVAGFAARFGIRVRSVPYEFPEPMPRPSALQTPQAVIESVQVRTFQRQRKAGRR